MKQGWENKKLEECFKLKSGDGLTSKMMSENGKYPVFGGNGIAGYHNEFNLFDSNIIIGRVGALCGNVRHMKEKMWLTDNAFRIVDFKFEFDHSFLTYLLNFKNLRLYARQAAQPVISNSSLKDVILEFPKSISEQQHISATLDEAFAAIAKAKSHAEQNLKNAKELFQAKRNEIFLTPYKHWKETDLEKIVDSPITKGATPTTYGFPFVEKGITFLRSECVSSNGFNIAGIRFISEEAHKQLNRSIIKSGDILISITGNIGRVVRYPIGMPNGNINQHIAIVRILDKNILPDFIVYQIQSDLIQKHYQSIYNGAAYPLLSLKQIRETKVFLPSMEEQIEIVTKLDYLSHQTKQLEANYQTKINDLEELKKSILKKAFNGELRTNKAMAI